MTSWAVHYTGFVYFPVAGTYCFSVSPDMGGVIPLPVIRMGCGSLILNAQNSPLETTDEGGPVCYRANAPGSTDIELYYQQIADVITEPGGGGPLPTLGQYRFNVVWCYAQGAGTCDPAQTGNTQPLEAPMLRIIP
jgi:hypothetical protein